MKLKLQKSILSYALLALLLVTSFWARAQSLGTGYSFSTNTISSLGLDFNSNVVNMTTGTNQLVAADADDGASALTNMGFTFNFAGSNYTQFSANSNGVIRLGATTIAGGTYSTNAATATSPHIAGLGGDLRTGISGKVHYKLIGTSPNRTLVIEFFNMSLDYVGTPGSNDGTFQVRLYETSNLIEFVYGSMFRNNSATNSPAQTFNISLATGTTSPNRICVDTNNALITTGTLTINNYVLNANMAKVHSTTEGSRRAYLFYVPVACNGMPTAILPALQAIPACGSTTFTLNGGNSIVTGLSYLWQSSFDSVNWSNLLIGDTLVNYTAAMVTTPTYYRRIITCTNTSQSAYSPGLKVLPLYGGLTQSTAPACGDSITLSLINNSSLVTSFQWEYSLDNFNFGPIQTTSANTYKLPSPTAITYYRAMLTCGSTFATAYSQSVMVKPVNGGTTAITSNICNDSTLLSVTGSSVGSSLTYQWESSSDSLNWTPVLNATNATYKFSQIATFMFFRRVTSCGAASDVSIAIKVTNGCNGFIYNTTLNNSVVYNSIQTTGNTFNWRETDGDDNSTFPVYFPAGFNFNYNNVTQPAFYVCTNGWLTFDTVTAYSTAWTNDLSVTSPKYILAPFWEDMVTLGNTFANCNKIKYEVQGSAPNRVMIVEWSEMERYQYGSPNLNFQVKFYEGTNNIEYVYGKMQAFDGSGTGAFDYSLGMTGGNPAAGQRLSLLLDNTNNFSSATIFNALTRVPLCNTSYLFTAGGQFTPSNTSAIPTNDSSGTPVVLTVNALPCTDGCGTYYTSKSATASGMGIQPPTSNPDDDVWFKFTAPASGQVAIDVFSSSGYNPAFQVMTTLFDSTGMGNAWFRDVNTNALEQSTVKSLTPFADYLIRVYNSGTGFGSTSGAFSICVSEIIPVPSNDTIGGAIILTAGVSCAPTAGTTLGATSSPQPVCGGLADDDVWYKFTPTSSVDTITVSGSGTFRAHVQVLNNQLVSMYCLSTTTNAGEVKITATGLMKDSTYYIRIYHTNAGTASANFAVCVTGDNATVPAVITGTVSNLTVSGGTFGGNITANGGFAILRSGIIISTTPNATLATFGVIDSSSNPLVTSGSYSINATGLNLATTYYVRAYATNGIGTAYGADTTFITPAAAIVPTVQKTAVSNLAALSASIGGNITSDGGSIVTASGVVFSTTTNPALFGFGVVDSTTNPVVATGTFSFNLAGLTPNTKYYYRAYASNSAGTAYSTLDSFETGLLVNTFPHLQNFDQAGNTGWSSMSTTVGSINEWVVGAPAKTTISSAFSAPNAWYTKASGDYSPYHDGCLVSPQIDFTSFTANPILRFKHKFLTEVNCCDGGWVEMSVNGGTWTKVENVLGTGANFNTTNATGWYNYAIGAGNAWNGISSTVFASSNNGWVTSFVSLPSVAGQSNVRIRFNFHSDVSGQNDGWAIDDIELFSPSAPTVITGTNSNLTTSNATLAGNILNDGGNTVTASGIVFSTIPAPTRGGFGVVDSSTNPLVKTGNFTINTIALFPATTYYYRAYAVNALGTSYGADTVFITPSSAVAPSVTNVTASNISAYAATAGGNITSDGGSGVTASGVVYSVSPFPVLFGFGVVDSATNPVVTSGSYSVNPVGLVPNTKYYFRSYATNLVGTGYGANDSFITLPVISSLPYNQDFEGGTAGWTIQTISANNWVLGTPAKTYLSGAHSGTQAWVTKLTGAYDNNTNSGVVSPQFNMSSLSHDPILRFYHKFVTELDYDAMIVETSIDGGNIWTKLDGNQGTGANYNTPSSYAWYNNIGTNGVVISTPRFTSNVSGSGSNTMYSSQVNGWVQSAVILSGLAGQANVKIRFNFGSDVSGQYEGWALDDIEVVSIDTPTITASNLNLVPANTSATLTLTKGNGQRRLVVARLATTAAVAPTNWTLYTANTIFGSGSTTGTGNYAVYSDTGATVTVTGLMQLTNYTFDVYEYDGKYMHNRFGVASSSNTTTTPVRLISFTGVNQRGDGLLTWATASEINNKGFEVERSIDGRTFVYVNFVSGSGNSNTIKRYQFTDVNVFNATGATKVYYRLKQLDRDGKYEYSNVITINEENNDRFAASAYPVPFSKEVTLAVTSTVEGTASIMIVDVQGRVIAERTANVVNGSNSFTLNEMDEVNTGVYFVKVIINNESRVVRLVKVN